jgi:hypothetical protein
MQAKCSQDLGVVISNRDREILLSQVELSRFFLGILPIPDYKMNFLFSCYEKFSKINLLKFYMYSRYCFDFKISEKFFAIIIQKISQFEK